MHWTRDSKALMYTVTRGGVSTIEIQTLADASERPLTDFGGDSVFSFDIAPDGRELASIRGIAVSDVIVLERAR